MTIQALEDDLAKLDYSELFLRLDDEQLNQIWSAVDSKLQLEQVVLNENLSTEVRFLAAEILFFKVPDYPPATHSLVLAHIYAQILAEGGSVNGNIWGMPGEADGETGKHLLRIGDEMVSSLVPLLSNETPIVYEGSEEATVGNEYQYRIKDLAAFFISKLLNLPYIVYVQPQERDAEIQRMVSHLNLSL